MKMKDNNLGLRQLIYSYIQVPLSLRSRDTERPEILNLEILSLTKKLESLEDFLDLRQDIYRYIKLGQDKALDRNLLKIMNDVCFDLEKCSNVLPEVENYVIWDIHILDYHHLLMSILVRSNNKIYCCLYPYDSFKNETKPSLEHCFRVF